MSTDRQIGLNLIMTCVIVSHCYFSLLILPLSQDRIVAQCLERGIAIYSPHTCYDALRGGVNDWLLSAFGQDLNATPLQQSTSAPPFSHRATFTAKEGKDAAQVAGCVVSKVPGVQASAQGSTIEVLCNASHLPALLEKFSNVLVTKLEALPIAGTGMGRRARLPETIPLQVALEKIKAHLHMPHVRLATAKGAALEELSVSSVAVCAGSGSSVLRGSKADLWLTGEMSHHEVRGREVDNCCYVDDGCS